MDTLQRSIHSMHEDIKSAYGKIGQEQSKQIDNLFLEANTKYKNMLETYNHCVNRYEQALKKEMLIEDRNTLEKCRAKLQKVFEDCNEISDSIDKAYNNLKNGGSKLVGNNYIGNLINDFNNYLSNLSLTEICLVINITSCIFILTCLVTIIFAFYGNLIISKFSLEKKYPKLANIINVRYTLQHTYIIVNTFTIVIALILMIIVNFVTLTN